MTKHSALQVTYMTANWKEFQAVNKFVRLRGNGRLKQYEPNFWEGFRDEEIGILNRVMYRGAFTARIQSAHEMISTKYENRPHLSMRTTQMANDQEGQML